MSTGATSSLVARLRAAGCIFAEEEAVLLVAEARSPDHLEAMVVERVSGRPLEHIVGWAEFRGRRILVGTGVFVPRRRTELLVDAALDRIHAHSVVVELCCGAGAIGAALLAESAHAVQLWAADIDPAAVASARHNLEHLGGHIVAGDLFDALPPTLRHRVDLIIANAPYVPTGAIATMPPEARDHEATIALDGGTDGLDVQRRIITGCRPWLAPGGAIVIETGERQAASTAALMRAAGLSPTVLRDEDLDGTAVIGEAVRR